MECVKLLGNYFAYTIVHPSIWQSVLLLKCIYIK